MAEKLFQIEVTHKLLVVAEDARAAGVIALANYTEEGNPEVACTEVGPHWLFTKDTMESLPWGTDGEITVGQFLENQRKRLDAPTQPMPLIKRKVPAKEADSSTVMTNPHAILQSILSLVLPCVPTIRVISLWSGQQRNDATSWASRAHARASDHADVVVPPIPEFLKKYETAPDAETTPSFVLQNMRELDE